MVSASKDFTCTQLFVTSCRRLKLRVRFVSSKRTPTQSPTNTFVSVRSRRVRFGEQERAEYLSEKFSSLGLTEVEIDEEGNCLGLIKGASRSPLIVVSAHLDTVFSSDTDFTVVQTREQIARTWNRR